MNVGLYQVWAVLQMSLAVTGQVSPLMQQLMRTQLLQNRAVDLLRQTTLNNLQNQADAVSGTDRSPFQIPSLSTTNRRVNNRNNNINNNRPSPVVVTTFNTNGMVPIDALLRQQRNLQSQILQNLMNSQGQGQGVSTIDVNVNTQQTPSQVFNRPSPSNRGSPSVDNVRVVLMNGNSNSGNGRNQPTQNTVSSNTPSESQSRSLSTNPFMTSLSSAGNTNSNGGFTGFGAFGFPSTSASFWTGSSFVSGTQQTPTSQSSSNSNTVRNNLSSPSANNDPNTQGSGSMFSTGFHGTGTGSDLTTGKRAFTSTTNIKSTPTQKPSALTCTEEFRNLAGHTLCMTDSPKVTRNGVAIDDAMMITQLHNSLRGKVQPPAADLLKLQWDDRLAAVAEKWAKQCTLAHDKERSIPAIGMSIGQNVAVGYESWRESIQQWYDEIRMYRYGLDPDSYLGTNGWKEIAHFTQMVQNGTYLVGCGYAECPNTRYVRYYVCNYAAGQSDLAYPYTAGSRCGSCPNRCINGLCDCGGLVCQNKGKLDPSTCSCKCPKPYKGSKCEIVDCPAEDRWICGRDWPPNYCERYVNIPEECPYMCGICGGGSSTSPSTGTPPARNMTFTSSFGCRYTGRRDDAATCKKYGKDGADMRVCATEGGSVGCSQCEQYFNIKKDYCPVMCGLCDPPCAGKKCMNGGTLNTQTCACNCKTPFTGDSCEMAQCPVNGDPNFCRNWPQRYCRLYYNVPEQCPYKCGICNDRNSRVRSPPQMSASRRASEANESS